ncbi:MAG: hypothetical protein HY532_01560 [Chloroflexi bacterium]|nr:hypothetical protein [Chloroflexota bacterium]
MVDNHGIPLPRGLQAGVLVLLFPVLLLFMACGDKAATTPTAGASATPTPTEPSSSSAAADPIELFERSEGALGQIKSYRYVVRMQFESKTTGVLDEGSMEIEGEWAGQDSYRIVIKDLATDSETGIVWLEGRMWMKEEGAAWEEMPSFAAPALQPMFDAFSFTTYWSALGGNLAAGASFKSRETVNGIATVRYTSSYKGWGYMAMGELMESTGEVWIAEQGGFPVKYLFKAKMRNGAGEEASVEWSGEIKDVNVSFTISPPA